MKGTPSRKAALVVCFSILVALPATCEQHDSTNRRSSEGQDIREAVIRKQMEDWIRNGDKDEADAKDKDEKAIAKMLNFKFFFVSVNERDPTDEFVGRFKGIPRVIKKLSACEISKAQRMPVIDKSSHERGIIFSADRIHWLSKDSAEVEGGYHCDGLCGAGIKFHVTRENGRWVVKSSKMQWIS